MNTFETYEEKNVNLKSYIIILLFRSSGPVSFGFSSLESPSTLKSIDGPNEFPLSSNSPPGSIHSSSSLKNELQAPQVNENKSLFYLLHLNV